MNEIRTTRFYIHVEVSVHGDNMVGYHRADEHLDPSAIVGGQRSNENRLKWVCCRIFLTQHRVLPHRSNAMVRHGPCYIEMLLLPTYVLASLGAYEA